MKSKPERERKKDFLRKLCPQIAFLLTALLFFFLYSFPPSQNTTSSPSETSPFLQHRLRSDNLELNVEEKEKKPYLNSVKQSEYAYVTLISGFDEKFKYRGFIYNAMIMKKALVELGSTADFIVMAVFQNNKNTSLFEEDMNLLRSHGIIVHYLERILDRASPLHFAEMALLKVTPYSYTDYKRLQFLDGDVMPVRNMDCYFHLNVNSFTIGAVSPLNSGWFLLLPDKEDYDYLISKVNSIPEKRLYLLTIYKTFYCFLKAKWRLGREWDEDLGWKERLPPSLFTRGGIQEVRRWNFNGADMDQGLLTHHFILNKGKGMLIDTSIKKLVSFTRGLLHQKHTLLPFPGPLSCCNGVVPTDMFAHFTGRAKPWMNDLTNIPARKRNLRIWAQYLDSLQLNINSSTIGTLGLGSPLGFWNAKLKVKKDMNVS